MEFVFFLSLSRHSLCLVEDVLSKIRVWKLVPLTAERPVAIVEGVSVPALRLALGHAADRQVPVGAGVPRVGDGGVPLAGPAPDRDAQVLHRQRAVAHRVVHPRELPVQVRVGGLQLDRPVERPRRVPVLPP
eukprot:CAMPEP_0194669446 /NCGR_PEP_ID=MMETSP0295-20121207/4588_1 /TAXON_ID=39354 /ORGANISM="Heterosigma akashiwo, Strain CCMP2393" /LENGTH=131 /DNA_ID=CAMNT_0039552433 /DNA_START=551 /DNA_END=946 /DNA_ORIENTATION=+